MNEGDLVVALWNNNIAVCEGTYAERVKMGPPSFRVAMYVTDLAFGGTRLGWCSECRGFIAPTDEVRPLGRLECVLRTGKSTERLQKEWEAEQ
jgi:hypothetical protein